MNKKSPVEQVEQILTNNKPSKLDLKHEKMREEISKTSQSLFINHWKNHIPVYGWTKMNYPNCVQPSLIEKYIERQKNYNKLEEIKHNTILNEELDSKNNNVTTQRKFEKKTFRVNPNIVNQDIVNENLKLVNPENNPSENALAKVNNKKLFYKNIINKLEERKQNIKKNELIPYNYTNPSTIPKLMVNQLGYKNSLAILTTNTFEKRQNNLEINFFNNTKYCTIFPKKVLLGDKPTNDFSKTMKKIGDISFEEEIFEPEVIKQLKRFTPDNLNNDVLKEFLNDQVQILNLSNHYWITQDVLHKLGKLAVNLKVLNLKSMAIVNSSLENILANAKR